MVSPRSTARSSARVHPVRRSSGSGATGCALPSPASAVVSSSPAWAESFESSGSPPVRSHSASTAATPTNERSAALATLLLGPAGGWSRGWSESDIARREYRLGSGSAEVVEHDVLALDTELFAHLDD